jgi:hypothetical protein
VLTETMERRPELGLNSYDRLFPSQDTMPQGGFGSLIALPLQKAPRDLGNSVFLDADLNPWPDQWAVLASLHRLGREQIERTVQMAERRGRVLGVRLPPQEDDEHEPWSLPPSRRPAMPPIAGALPEAIELVLGNQIYIAKEGLPPGCATGCCGLRRFRIPRSTRLRHCGSRPTAHRALSPVPKISRITSVCREAASRRCCGRSAI